MLTSTIRPRLWLRALFVLAVLLGTRGLVLASKAPPPPDTTPQPIVIDLPTPPLAIFQVVKSGEGQVFCATLNDLYAQKLVCLTVGTATTEPSIPEPLALTLPPDQTAVFQRVPTGRTDVYCAVTLSQYFHDLACTEVPAVPAVLPSSATKR